MPDPSGLLIDGVWEDGGEPPARARQVPPRAVRRGPRARARTTSSAPSPPPRAAPPGRRCPAWRRAEILEAAAGLLAERAEQVIETYIAETGFTRADAAAELRRAGETLRLSAGEAVRLTGETVPVEARPGSEDRLAFTLRVPVGVVCAIAPFNAPLNTVAHKVAPGARRRQRRRAQARRGDAAVLGRAVLGAARRRPAARLAAARVRGRGRASATSSSPTAASAT